MFRLEAPYHQSLIRDYLSCPQALMLRLEGVEPLFRPLGLARGAAVHNAIRALHAEQAWSRWSAVFDRAWNAEFSSPGPPINAMPEEIDREYDSWRTVFGNYVQRERDTEVLFTELPVRGIVVSRSGREYEVAGTLDQIRSSQEPGGYDLYELKSSATLPGRASLERNVQLCLYAWCCVTGEARVNGQWQPARRILPGFLRRCVCYKLVSLMPYKRAGRRADGTRYAAGDLRGDPLVPIAVTSDRLVEGARGIARIIAAIRAGGFYWNPSSLYGGCDACPYKYACGNNFSSNSQAKSDVPEPVRATA